MSDQFDLESQALEILNDFLLVGAYLDGRSYQICGEWYFDDAVEKGLPAGSAAFWIMDMGLARSHHLPSRPPIMWTVGVSPRSRERHSVATPSWDEVEDEWRLALDELMADALQLVEKHLVDKYEVVDGIEEDLAAEVGLPVPSKAILFLDRSSGLKWVFSIHEAQE